MAWYEQLDLDFGNITDQFTDLIGEASTLLENANNLEILNLDAMAIQEELEEELAADQLEYEEENDEDDEVVHHDQAQDEFVPEVVHHSYNDGVISSPPSTKKVFAQNLTDKLPNDISSPERHTSIYRDASSAPTSTVKQLQFDLADQSFDQENTTEVNHDEGVPEPQPLDDSFAWDAIEDKTPKKSTKLLSQIRDRSTNNTEHSEGLNTPENTNTNESNTVKQTTTSGDSVASVTKQKTGQQTVPGGRKAKPLKPKPKVSKEFDFWGVNSKKTLNFDVLKNKNKTGNSGAATLADANNIDNNNVSADISNSITDATNAVSEHFYGVVGLFGDDYATDNVEPDIGSHPSTNEDATNTNNDNTTHSVNTAHRLPLGWLSDIYSTTTSAQNESFFDHLEEEEDPILRQVELNKTNPYNSVSNVDRLWNMWENMTGGDVEANTHEVGTNNTDNGSVTSASVSTFVPVITPGVGPGWVVTCLNAIFYVTGVTIMVLSAGNTVVYSGDISSTPNNNYPHWNVFTVKLTQPIDNEYKAVLLFSLSLLRMVIIILLAIVIRTIVFVCKLLGMCIMYGVTYFRTTALGARVSRGRARLRAFFTNERVDRILGGSEAPSELTWQERTIESGRSLLHASYEQMNSTNAIMLLTAGLFLFSYFKFQRYGTDAGD